MKKANNLPKTKVKVLGPFASAALTEIKHRADTTTTTDPTTSITITTTHRI